MMEPSLFSLYLHQNMPTFFADIDEMADCLESFSQQDGVISSLEYSYSSQQEIYELKRLSSVLCGLSMTETNLHCLDANKGKGTNQNAFTCMQKPYFFEHLQKLKSYRFSFRDVLKENQLVKGEIFSEDLLIRSQREAQASIVPFLFQMPLVNNLSHEFSELKINRWAKASQGSIL